MGITVKILFLSANSSDTARLRLDAEVRAIDEALLSSKYRDKFDFAQHWAVRVSDLQSLFLRHDPNIVQFSGHGSIQGEICLEDDFGNTVVVPNSTLADLFHLYSSTIECVVLNSCYSENQAKSIAKHVRHVIGMPEPIRDDVAIKFSQSFYRALGFGKDIPLAFRSACLQLELLHLDIGARPVLMVNPLPDQCNEAAPIQAENTRSRLNKIVSGLDTLEFTSLRIMAGPGTGKTTAMQQYVANLLSSGTAPQKILAVTFTRVAASELVSSLNSLGIPGCSKIRAGTLHSYCFALLSKQNVFDHLNRIARPVYTIMKSKVLKFEGKPLLDDLWQENNVFGKGRQCTERIIAFEAAWARLQNEEPGWPEDPLDRQFHDCLLRWLQFHQAILIGELVPESLRFLRDNPMASERSAYEFVVVDEYQDLNKAEQVLIEILAENSRSCVIGDADQSIYSFRHAHPEGILEYQESHPDTVNETYEICLRCPQRVVKMANHLIKHNHLRDDTPRLSPSPSNPIGEVHIVQWESLEQETSGLARYVSHLISSRKCNPGDILILSPRSLIGYQIRNHLVALNVPTYSFYYEELLESEESQRALTLLNLLVNPDDRVSLRYWLGLGSPTSNAGEYARLRDYCENCDFSPREVLDELITERVEIKRTSRIMANYAKLVAARDELKEMAGFALIDALFPENEDLTQPLRHLANMTVEEDTDPKSVYDQLMTRLTQPEMPEEGEYVRVMSLHKSKGLTAKHVIIAGCMEGVIPHREREATLSEQRQIVEEQRRLFYVAITRCRESLVLSSINILEKKIAYQMNADVRDIPSDWTNGRTIASSFINELGPDAPRSKNGHSWLNGGFRG